MMKGEVKLMSACVLVGAILLCASGCGTFRETLPERSALEQLLISTAADRAVDQLALGWASGKTVTLDLSNLEAYDKAYLVQRMRYRLLKEGGRLPPEADNYDVLIELASGANSIDNRSYMLGIPSIPLSIPGMGTVNTPELALFKYLEYRGKSKILASAVDPNTRGQLHEMPEALGGSRAEYWWVLFLGPFGTNDLPKIAKE